jgi:uncharacterized protein
VAPTLVSPSPATRGQDRLLTRRNFLRLGAVSAAGLAFYAGEIARHAVEVLCLTIALPGLPDAFAGMRIAQISDIHFEEFTEASFLEAVVDKVNALAPDLVVLTGDFVSAQALPRRWDRDLSYHCAAILSTLKCPLRYAVLGNHDVLAGAAAVTNALETNGIPVLVDSAVPLERDGRRIWLAGTRDALEQHPNMASVLPVARQRDREPLILLAHEPDFADRIVGSHVDLMLSGHTHGGQVRIPFAPPMMLPPMGKRYLHGLYRMPDGMQLYVNRGIGTVGLPFRFRCPPEITVISLAQG